MLESGKIYLKYIIKKWKIIKMHLWSFRTWARFSAINVIGNIFLDGAIYTKTSYLHYTIFLS